MALEKALELSGIKLLSGSGFVYQVGPETITTEPLYVKVDSVNSDKTSAKASVSFSLGKEGTHVMARDYVFPLNLDGPNSIKQAYLHLKTLAEFADAVDC